MYDSGQLMKSLVLLLTFCISVCQVCCQADPETCYSDNYIGIYGSGIITSDNFPFNYRNALTSSDLRHCRHRIYFDHDLTNPTRIVCFTFFRFDLEDSLDCVNDYLQFPGENGDYVKYCGRGSWDKGNEVSIISNVFSQEFCWPANISPFEINFKADARVNGTGYYAEFQVIDEPEEMSDNSMWNRMDEAEHPNQPEEKEKEDSEISKIDTTPFTTIKPSKTTKSSTIHSSTTSKPFFNVTFTNASAPINNSNAENEKAGHEDDVENRKKRQAPETGTCDFDPTKCTQYCFHGHVEIDGCKTCQCIEGTHAPCFEKYTCFNRRCVDKSALCNGTDECGDNSDEDFNNARCPGVQDVDSCTFDDFQTGMCKYVNLQGWSKNYTSSLGPRYDHTYGIAYYGYFLHTQAFKLENRLALLSYPAPVYRETEQCYSFWFFMSGVVGQLQILIESEFRRNERGSDFEGDLPPVWRREGNYDPRWLQAEISIPAHIFPVTMIMFKYIEAHDETSNMAIDDIFMMEGNCFGSDFSCEFELDFCGWQNNMTLGKLEWQRHFGETDTEGTGPSTDRHGDKYGYYVYMDSTLGYPGDRAVLISRPLSNDASGDYCLSFWCHLYGQSVDALEVKALFGNGTTKMLYKIPNNKGDYWIYVALNIMNLDRPFQVLFEGIKGADFKSDIALDDIIITRRLCTNNIDPGPKTTVSVTVGPPPTCPPGDFVCDNGTCRSSDWVCDGRSDCRDGTDEINCGRLLNTGVIVGICIALSLLVIVFVLAMFFVHHRRKLAKQARRQARPIDPSLYYDPTEDDLAIHGYGGPDFPPPYNLVADESAYLGPETQLPTYSSVAKKPPPYKQVTNKLKSKTNHPPANKDLVGFGAQGLPAGAMTSLPPVHAIQPVGAHSSNLFARLSGNEGSVESITALPVGHVSTHPPPIYSLSNSSANSSYSDVLANPYTHPGTRMCIYPNPIPLHSVGNRNRYTTSAAGHSSDQPPSYEVSSRRRGSNSAVNTSSSAPLNRSENAPAPNRNSASQQQEGSSRPAVGTSQAPARDRNNSSLQDSSTPVQNRNNHSAASNNNDDGRVNSVRVDNNRTKPRRRSKRSKKGSHEPRQPSQKAQNRANDPKTDTNTNNIPMSTADSNDDNLILPDTQQSVPLKQQNQRKPYHASNPQINSVISFHSGKNNPEQQRLEPIRKATSYSNVELMSRLAQDVNSNCDDSTKKQPGLKQRAVSRSIQDLRPMSLSLHQPSSSNIDVSNVKSNVKQQPIANPYYSNSNKSSSTKRSSNEGLTTLSDNRSLQNEQDNKYQYTNLSYTQSNEDLNPGSRHSSSTFRDGAGPVTAVTDSGRSDSYRNISAFSVSNGETTV